MEASFRDGRVPKTRRRRDTRATTRLHRRTMSTRRNRAWFPSRVVVPSMRSSPVDARVRGPALEATRLKFFHGAAAKPSLPIPSPSIDQALAGKVTNPRATRAVRVRGATLKVRADAKQLTFDMKSRMKIQEGIDIVADAVGVTLGPRGEFPAHSSSCIPRQLCIRPSTPRRG